MKERLNTLTVCLLIAFSLQFIIDTVIHIGDFVEGFKYGYSEGYKEGEKIKKNFKEDYTDNILYLSLNLTPKNHTIMNDSIYNNKTDSRIPIQIENAEIKIEGVQRPLGMVIFLSFISISLIPIFIMIIVSFFKLIVAVNRSSIFIWENIKRIRKIGVGLILFFIASVLIKYINYQMVTNFFSNDYYTIHIGEIYNNSNLIMGLIALLVAEIFAIGVKLQEEQELTI